MEHADIQVVAPVPWCPLPGLGVWSQYRTVPAREVLDGIPVHRPRRFALPRRILFTQLWRFYLNALERAPVDAPDLIHAHWAYPEGRAALEFGSKRRIPVIITAHGSDVRVWPHLKPRWREPTATALRGADAVIAVSQDLRERVLEFGAAPGKVHVITNGVDCSRFTPSTTSPERSDTGAWRVLFVGRFVREKGIGVLLDAVAKLIRRGQRIHLTLIGGNPHARDARPFQARAESLGIGDHVRFLDEVRWETLPEHLRAADVFVLPSYSEGMPLVLLEAMACGLPLVATRCGGPEELIDDQVGLLVDAGDVDGLSDALARMLADYGRYDRGQIRRRAVERYDHARIGARVAAVYRSVLESSPA